MIFFEQFELEKLVRQREADCPYCLTSEKIVLRGEEWVLAELAYPGADWSRGICEVSFDRRTGCEFPGDKTVCQLRRASDFCNMRWASESSDLW